MKFLVDENIPHSLVIFLRDKGYQIIDVKKSKYVHFDDLRLITIATKNNYIILTYDKDFLTFNKEGFDLKCIILNINSIDIPFLQLYLTTLLQKYKSILKRKGFILFCKKDTITLL